MNTNLAEACAADYHEFCDSPECDCECHYRSFSVDWRLVMFLAALTWPVLGLLVYALYRAAGL